jgi:hypothetical protein
LVVVVGTGQGEKTKKPKMREDEIEREFYTDEDGVVVLKCSVCAESSSSAVYEAGPSISSAFTGKVLVGDSGRSRRQRRSRKTFTTTGFFLALIPSARNYCPRPSSEVTSMPFTGTTRLGSAMSAEKGLHTSTP